MGFLSCLFASVLALVNVIPQPSLVVADKGCYKLRSESFRDEMEVSISPALKREAYILDITRKGISVTAGSDAGVFYACQTISQLGESELPCVHIEDAPAYDYRGMMLDCSRHFWTVEEIKTVLDLLALHKINTFHWHLTDDQGWRIEIKKYPELTRVGNYRPYTLSWPGWNPDGWIPDGIPVDGYYTQEQIREIVEYAAERYITVIPEIEVPGHSTAALASYPWLGCRGEGYQVVCQQQVCKDVYCPGKETTFEFLENVLSEVFELFPSEYIHLGGDECLKDEWRSCPNCQKRIADEGLSGVEQLQSYTMKRVEAFVRSAGRKIIGWDEIAQGGLSSTAAVMMRYGPERVRPVLEQGNRVILCPAYYCYFDYYQSAEHDKEPHAHKGANLNLNLETAYSLDPKENYTPSELNQVIGLECCLWTEFVPVFSHLQYMLLPRLDAFSEAAWSTGPRDYGDFVGRLGNMAERYDALGINYARHCFENAE
ncbi:MAG: beta-N-acetylhexosaminidase [Candidatus Cryptobacteroides sp.]